MQSTPLPFDAARNQTLGSQLPPFWKKLPKSGENNLWFERNHSDTVFVLVHGIFSDSRGCWLYVDHKEPANNEYWPELIKTDERLEHPSIYLGGYYTALDAGPYDAHQAVKELRDALKRDGVLDKRRLVFIAHSTGGIIVRYLLYHNQELFRGKEIGLALYASPSMGSPHADTLSWLSEFYNQQLGSQLQTGSPFLKELDLNFRDLIYNANSSSNGLHIVGAEAVENHFIIHKKFLPDKVLVVPEDSASRYFGSPTYLRNTDHFSTVKPDGPMHPGHQFLVTFYERFKTETKPITSRDVDNLPSLAKKVEYITHTKSTRSLRLQMAGVELEELKFAVVSSGVGRYSISKLSIHLLGYADCKPKSFEQFAARYGTPSYEMWLSPEASEYDLFPQDQPGVLGTWLFKDDDFGEFWIRLKGQVDRLYVLSVELRAEDLDKGAPITVNSKPFQYFYASNGVSPECLDIKSWYRAELLKKPRDGSYRAEQDLLTYQLLTADFRYARALLDKVGADRLHQQLPDIKAEADRSIDNPVYAENLEVVASYLDRAGKLDLVEDMFCKRGLVVDILELAEKQHLTVPKWITEYSQTFTARRKRAYTLYDIAERDPSYWAGAALAFDGALEAAAKATTTSDRSLTQSTEPVFKYDAACTYSRAGQLDKAANTLASAIKAGYRNVGHMRSDADLKPLQVASPVRFEELMRLAAEPSK